MKYPKLGVVRWNDAHVSPSQWNPYPSEYEPARVVSSGFIHEANDGVIVFQTLPPESVENWHEGENAAGQWIMIPRGCIESVEYL